MLRAGLLKRLPEYMVPSHFMVLAALPLMSNGKVDRKALPAPDLIETERAYEAPRNVTEQTLADLLADVLKRERVGIHDNFFALGGHSLQVLMMLSRIGKRFNVELEPRTLFEAPTIAGLAARVDLKAAQAAGKTQASAPALVRVSRDSRRAKLQGKELVIDKFQEEKSQ
jgi:acyl carrier protein